MANTKSRYLKYLKTRQVPCEICRQPVFYLEAWISDLTPEGLRLEGHPDCILGEGLGATSQNGERRKPR